MKLFVTGGTGVLGRPVIRRLVQAGHEVRAPARSPANRDLLLSLGAVPVVADLCKVDQLLPQLEGCDAVLHLATQIPTTARMRQPGAWAENDRLRKEATCALVDAALETRTVRTFVYPGVFFMYSGKGDSWQSADHATLDPPRVLTSTLAAERSVARFAAESAAHRGITLRFGGFYGPTSRDSRDMLNLARRGIAVPVAPPAAYRSMIWIEDAAAAVVAALMHAPSGVFDVAEDQPFTQAEALQALARAVGRRRVLQVPRVLLRAVLTPELRQLLARSQRVRSNRFRDVTGWAAEVPDQRVGWARIAAALRAETPVQRPWQRFVQRIAPRRSGG